MNRLPSEPRLHLGDHPHLLSLEQLLAAVPVILWATLLFGGGALLRILLSALFVLLLDIAGGVLQNRLLHRNFPKLRLRGAVVGLVIALLSPSDLPIWLLLMADLPAVAILQIFRSESHFPVSLTALCGCFLLLFEEARRYPLLIDSENGVTLAERLGSGDMPSLSIEDMLLGRMDGNMGEIASLLLLLGGVYLLYRRQIGWRIPLAGIVAAALTAYITAPDTMSVYYYAGAQLLSGSFLLVLIFITADRTAAPITARAELVCGALFGLLTILLRNQTGLDGSLPAALICSLLSRPLDRMLAPLPFGGRRT
ncbi:MAG: RnfABCDGE type electron transport complex subunit D [Clostridia bacterium]|nr:RnfABCDGE type electron transport complex subunit D [Clostridia bacterium]